MEGRALVCDGMQPLVNRVAASSLATLKLDELVPPVDTVPFDLADYLWQGLALREKDFRAALKAYDWSQVVGKRVCVWCSADAIVPQWAYMLVAARAAEYTDQILVGPPEHADADAFALAAATVDVEPYRDLPVVVKGCTDGREVGPRAYALITARLRRVARSVSYGEPCSTVPIWKRSVRR